MDYILQNSTKKKNKAGRWDGGIHDRVDEGPMEKVKFASRYRSENNDKDIWKSKILQREKS